MKNPRTLIRIGSLSLILAILSLRFIHPATAFWIDASDGVTGFLFGIQIATFGLAAHFNARSGRGGGACA